MIFDNGSLTTGRDGVESVQSRVRLEAIKATHYCCCQPQRKNPPHSHWLIGIAKLVLDNAVVQEPGQYKRS